MSEFDNYTRVKDGLPQKNMFCTIVGIKPDGVYKTMKVFYRAKPKIEYFVDNNGIKRKRVSKTGFVLQKPHNNLTILAWKEYEDANNIVKALYGENR